MTSGPERTLMLVVDASVVVGALVQTGPVGDWAADLLEQPVVSAELMPVEVLSAMRRLVRSDRLDAPSAQRALQRMQERAIPLGALEPHLSRVWALRETVTPYDAWYVVMAEQLDLPLATLDRRLSTASGPRCRFELPPPAPHAS